ncbi:MAG: LysM peptidoglycan-binding domain-containing protein, partial [Candidatus Saccharibacteria bacterium]
MRKTTWISIMVLGILVLLAPAALADEIYIVQKGDSIWKIAKQHSVSVKKIIEANNLEDENSLQIGDKIIIPCDNNKPKEQPKVSEKPKKPVPPPPVPPEPQQTVTVVYNNASTNQDQPKVESAAPADSGVEPSRGLDINSNLI